MAGQGRAGSPVDAHSALSLALARVCSRSARRSVLTEAGRSIAAQLPHQAARRYTHWGKPVLATSSHSHLSRPTSTTYPTMQYGQSCAACTQSVARAMLLVAFPMSYVAYWIMGHTCSALPAPRHYPAPGSKSRRALDAKIFTQKGMTTDCTAPPFQTWKQ